MSKPTSDSTPKPTKPSETSEFDSTEEPASYAELNGRLEAALAVLESDELDVDEAVEAYGTVMKLAAQLEAYLAAAEIKVEIIQKQFGQSADTVS